MNDVIPAKRPVVKILPGPDDTLVVVCKVDGCDYMSGRHGVKASAEEYARYHRGQHRDAFARSPS